MERPRACVLQTDGVNCDEEMAYAWNLAGGSSDFVHVNDLLWGKQRLADFQSILCSGGFSYGDHIRAGLVMGQEMVIGLHDQIEDFVKNQKGLVLGVCNGFQVLAACGLLPFGKVNTAETADQIDITLTDNDIGHFKCDWVDLRVEKESPCKFLDEMPDYVKYMGAHGEGKFYTKTETLKSIEEQNLVVFRYVDAVGSPTQRYPANPNGSLNAIAGVCDPTGRILGLMPHPERYVLKTQYDNWRRGPNIREPHGLALFKGMISYAKES